MAHATIWGGAHTPDPTRTFAQKSRSDSSRAQASSGWRAPRDSRLAIDELALRVSGVSRARCGTKCPGDVMRSSQPGQFSQAPFNARQILHFTETTQGTRSVLPQTMPPDDLVRLYAEHSSSQFACLLN